MKKHKPLISEDKGRVYEQIIKIVFSKFFSRPKHTFMYTQQQKETSFWKR